MLVSQRQMQTFGESEAQRVCSQVTLHLKAQWEKPAQRLTLFNSRFPQLVKSASVPQPPSLTCSAPLIAYPFYLSPPPPPPHVGPWMAFHI